MDIKKNISILFIILLFSPLYSEDINELLNSKNRKLYTDFVAVRVSPYLKKPKVSSGYIVADGDRFVFKQTEPVKMEIRQKNGLLTIKLPGNSEIVVDSSSNEYSDDVMFLFDTNFDFNDNFIIKKYIINNKNHYELIPTKPKLAKKISLISLVALEDRLESMKLTFKNNSSIMYEFKNTVVGVTPNEELFEDSL